LDFILKYYQIIDIKDKAIKKDIADFKKGLITEFLSKVIEYLKVNV